jgi:methionine synthase I (cobalamin-dependent)
MSSDKPSLEALMNERILILDGAMGSMLQRYELTESDFRGARFASHPKDLMNSINGVCQRPIAKILLLALFLHEAV